MSPVASSVSPCIVSPTARAAARHRAVIVRKPVRIGITVGPMPRGPPAGQMFVPWPASTSIRDRIADGRTRSAKSPSRNSSARRPYFLYSANSIQCRWCRQDHDDRLSTKRIAVVERFAGQVLRHAQPAGIRRDVLDRLVQQPAPASSAVSTPRHRSRLRRPDGRRRALRLIANERRLGHTQLRRPIRGRAGGSLRRMDTVMFLITCSTVGARDIHRMIPERGVSANRKAVHPSGLGGGMPVMAESLPSMPRR